MAQRKLDLKKIFQPSDAIAFIVILIGLFIALFLDEMAVRLIGVCITILGGVALFMMVSPRLTDMSMTRPPKPSESPSFMSETRQDALKKSQVFDSIAYRATFGAEEPSEEQLIDEDQIELFPELMEQSESQPAGASDAGLEAEEFSDGQSSVRILGTKRSRVSKAEPELAIKTRATKRTAATSQPIVPVETRKEPEGDAVIAGPVSEEIQLSDDVIVRPKSAGTPKPPTSNPPPAPSMPTEEAEQDEPSDKQPEVVEDVTPAPTPEPVPETPAKSKRKRPEISVSAFMLEADDEMEVSDEPRKEFDYLLNRVLMVIRSAVPARTAAFFWFNRDKQQLVLEAKITDATDDITDKRKIPIGHDAVSQIALEGRPEILTEISPAAELELLPYYKFKPGTKSFVGVPVYFKGNVIGVLCADSAEEDVYTEITVGFFGHFTKLISGLVSSYTRKFDLQQSARKLEAMQQFREAAAEQSSEEGVVDDLFDSIIHHMDVSTIGVCSYDRSQKKWVVLDARSVVDGYDGLVGKPVDLNNALVGEALKGGEVVVQANPSGVRISPNEYELDDGQIVIVPLRSDQRTYGALYIENLQGSLSSQDISLAEILGDTAGDVIERIRQSDQLSTGALVESETDLLNKEGVNRRLREEFSRSTDYQSPLTVCLVQVDKVASKTSDSAEVQQQVMKKMIDRVREQLRDYDIVGKFSENTLIIGLVSYKSQEAQFWVEGLRRDIASSPFDVQGKRITATISVGIAESNPEDTWDSLIDHASAALDISAKQQNKVTVFS